ncbi:MAG: hypothetical protein F4X17_18815 [Gemmatimonadetes bacterium]|nr:hypothetical protein [Gemmatimonadota bacterium]
MLGRRLPAAASSPDPSPHSNPLHTTPAAIKNRPHPYHPIPLYTDHYPTTMHPPNPNDDPIDRTPNTPPTRDLINSARHSRSPPRR